MPNFGNVYIWGSTFVMSRIDAQNVVEIIFNVESRQTPILFIINKYNVSPKKVPSIQISPICDW
jgi:hypothetical protein